MMTGNLQRQYRPFRRLLVVLSMLLLLAPMINATANIAGRFHNTQQNEQATPCHENQAETTKCCCDVDTVVIPASAHPDNALVGCQ